MSGHGKDVYMVYNYEYVIPLCSSAERTGTGSGVHQDLKIKHGAFPNVYRGDGRHLLSICRERDKWIDDDSPSEGNKIYQQTARLGVPVAC